MIVLFFRTFKFTTCICLLQKSSLLEMVAGRLIALVAVNNVGHAFGEECTPLAEVAAGNTILLTAVKKAGLLDALTAEDAAFTIFAPTDEAFVALLETLKISAKDLWKQPEVLKEILTYHVLATPAKAADLVSGQAYTTLSADNSCGVSDVTVEVSDIQSSKQFGGTAILLALHFFLVQCKTSTAVDLPSATNVSVIVVSGWCG